MIKITNGSQIREVTETVGKDLKTLTTMGWWVVETPKQMIVEEVETKEFDQLSKAEIVELLKEKGVSFNVNDKKEKLISILKGETQNGN